MAKPVIENTPTAPIAPTISTAPAPAPASTTSPVATVSAFYRALSVADGRAAAALVVPQKRGAGPFEAAAMTRFYGSFREPLTLRAVRQIDRDTVEAKYRYRAASVACDGTATVDTQRVANKTLIARIRANC